MPQEKISKSEFARRMDVTPQNVTRWLSEGKLKGCLTTNKKKILWPQGRDQVKSLLNPLLQKGPHKQWGKSEPTELSTPKNQPPPKQKKPKKKPTEAQVKEILESADLDINMSISEGQRLKLLYESGLKKLEYDQKAGSLIEADVVKRESFSAGLQIREGLESIAERCAPLVAASDDQFECREILFKEINHVLNGMADALEVVE